MATPHQNSSATGRTNEPPRKESLVMRIKVTTVNGSEYVFDSDNMTWKQVTETKRSGEHRSRKGTLEAWPTFRIGHGLLFFDDDVRPECSDHAVWTSYLVKIELL